MDPNNPLNTPTNAPSPYVMPGRCFIRSVAAMPPPSRTHMQHRQLAAEMNGMDERNPKNIPPARAGLMKSNWSGGPCCCGVSDWGGACVAVPHCKQNFASSGKFAPHSLHCFTNLLDCPFDKRRCRQSDENAGER